MQWKSAKKYRKSGLVLSAVMAGDGAEVEKVGNSVNVQLGIHALDRLVGIQNTDVRDAPFTEVEALLKAALRKLKKKTPLTFRLAHQTAKFKDLPKKVGEGEIDVTFHDQPMGRKGGLTFMKHNGELAVAKVREKSFAYGHHIIPGHTVVGIDGKDVRDSPSNIVMHMVQFAEVPVDIRFRAVEEKSLSLSCCLVSGSL